tara:strand:- start:387 stop:1112 length:726 start_codon:yes stop_codon:yes gene_type:complete
MFKKKNIVYIFADEQFLLDHKVVEPYKNCRPSWFKDIPLHAPKNEITPGHEINYKTFKGCGGIYEFLDDTFLLKWWADININYDINKYDYDVSISTHGAVDTNAGSHFESYKYYDYVPSKALEKIVTLTAVKLKAPFFISSDVSNRMMLLNPFYEYQRAYEVVPGMYDCKYVPQLNVMIEPYERNLKLLNGDGAMQLFFPDADDVKIEVASQKQKDEYNQKMTKLLSYKKNRYIRVQKNEN